MEKYFSPIKKRILLYADNKGYSKRKIYLDTGISNGVFDKESGLTEDSIEKFISIYKDINLEWLLTGKGDMIKQQNQTSIPNDRINELNELIDMQRKLIKSLEADVKRLESELNQTKSFHETRVAADVKLKYDTKK